MNLCGKKQKRRFLSFLAGMFLLAFFLSVFSVLHHVDHDCTGEDCPVCLIINNAKVNFQNLTHTGNLIFKMERLPFYETFTLPCSVFFANKTPVSERIRLNN